MTGHARAIRYRAQAGEISGEEVDRAEAVLARYRAIYRPTEADTEAARLRAMSPWDTLGGRCAPRYWVTGP